MLRFYSVQRQKKQIASFFLIFCLFLSANFLCAEDVNQPSKRISAHLLIGDVDNAIAEAVIALKSDPKNILIWEGYIKALAKSGNEKQMMQAWNSYIALNPLAYEQHTLLESMCWGIIENGTKSSSPIVRISALLGAYFGQDSKGVSLLCKHLHDSNSLVRAVSAKLAGTLRDASLSDQMLKLLDDEHVWRVRVEVINSIGNMKVVAAKPTIISILSDDRATAEERVAAVQSLVALLDTADRSSVAKLATSNRAGLRLVACEMVSHFHLVEALPEIFPLLMDPHSEVRAAVLQTLGLLRVTNFQDKTLDQLIQASLKDPEPKVAITAAWVLTLYNPKQGEAAFRPWLEHPNKDVRILASAALGACGQYGSSLIQETFFKSKDSYVRLNLALALIKQRKLTDQACQVLLEGLLEKERWMWNDLGVFRALAPSTIRNEEGAIENSEATNQMTRLEILNIIAIMEGPKAQEAITQYLQQKSWGISATASALLLVEGAESALDLVKNLLNSPIQKVKVQAALILALWGREEQSITVLQEAYGNADRDLKEKILEGIGRVGAHSSIPFLVDKLQEPYQLLRIIAASSLLECMYH